MGFRGRVAAVRAAGTGVPGLSAGTGCAGQDAQANGCVERAFVGAVMRARLSHPISLWQAPWGG